MRSLSNFDSGYPHMRGHITNHAATVAEVLRDEGYATFAVGKWHLCAMDNASAAGPYDQWPCQRGFDRFYGFLEGETDQFHPELVYDNHSVEPPATPEDGYHLSEDLVDHAIGFIHDTTSIRPDRPFFTYLAFGAMHAPHQAPAAYLEKYRGRFDEGWDVARDRWFARQQELGLLPPGTELAPRNPGVEPWDSLPENHRRLAARLQEAFAAFLEHTDDQIGRFVAALEELGRLDNTLILLLSDNGASQEGGPFGVLHEMKYFNFLAETPDEAVERIDDIGGPHSHANYPWGWAQAGNTPFKWYKQNTHEGGVHVPLIVHWPGRITDGGALRHQFHHVSDLVPTIYETLGVEAPSTYRGLEQIPVSGISLHYSFDDPDEPSRKHVQYFEMMGHRGIYADGWKAVTRHQPGVPFEDDDWELYHLDRGPLRVPQPGRRAARAGGRAGRPVVAARPRSTGSCPSTTAPSSCSSPATATGRPTRPTATTPTTRRCPRCPARPPRPSAAGAGTWPPPSTGPRGPAACSTPRATRTRGSACSSRTTAWSSTTTASATTTWSRPRRPVPVGPVGGRRAASSAPAAAARPPWSSTARPSGSLDVPFVMTMISSVGPERRLRPRLTGQRALRGAAPLRGDAAPAGHRADPAAAVRATRTPRRPSGRPCPASDGGGSGAVPGQAGEPGRGAGIHVDHRPGDVAGPLGGQEDDGGGDLLGLEPRHRLHVEGGHARRDVLAGGVLEVRPHEPVEGVVVDHGGRHVARGDGVDGHPEVRPARRPPT